MAELDAERARYGQLTRELADYKLELDERERALHPEKTVADLASGIKEDTVFGEDGTPQVRQKKVYRAEDDLKLPPESRELARKERLAKESAAAAADLARSNAVLRLESLYTAAQKEDRPVDAEHYRQALKSLYPDWKLAPGKPAEEEKKQ